MTLQRSQRNDTIAGSERKGSFPRKSQQCHMFHSSWKNSVDKSWPAILVSFQQVINLQIIICIKIHDTNLRFHFIDIGCGNADTLGPTFNVLPDFVQDVYLCNRKRRILPHMWYMWQFTCLPNNTISLLYIANESYKNMDSQVVF